MLLIISMQKFKHTLHQNIKSQLHITILECYKSITHILKILCKNNYEIQSMHILRNTKHRKSNKGAFVSNYV